MQSITSDIPVSARLRRGILHGCALVAALALGIAPIAAHARGALKVGERVQVPGGARVWASPPLAGRMLGEQAPAAQGLVLAGPVRAAEALWWKVNFDRGWSGWVVDRQLAGMNQAGPPREQRPAPMPPRPVAKGFASLNIPTGATVHSPRIVVDGVLMPDVYAPSLTAFSVEGTSVPMDQRGRFTLSLMLHPGVNSLTLLSCTPNARQHPNLISAYLDGSVIYGTDAARAAALRSFQGGRLLTSAGNLPPLNTGGFANANDAHLFPDNELFLAGDVRANENAELTAIHTLFVREHNQIATAIAAGNLSLSDEQVFQLTRRIVVAELQAITYNEFLPALLGAGALRPYSGYNPNVNAGIATEFSTAAYRIGHTLINDDVEFLDNDGNPMRDALELAEAFFNPSILKETGPDPLLKYLATDNAQEVDTLLVPSLRNFLFGPPGAGGFDLAALNIQRGRDHGLADYNSTRAAYGLPRVASFAEITSNPKVQADLAALYPDVNSVDLWIGGLAEDHALGSSVGPTFQRIIADQFERIRAGDRMWYEAVFAGPQLQALQQTRLSDVIRRNTTITKLQDNVFFFHPGDLASLPVKAGFLPPALTGDPLNVPRFVPASLDGTGNNIAHPAWGSAGVDLMRLAPASYGDGLNSPAGDTRPSARVVSNAMSEQTDSVPNARELSDWIYGWGQFIDHDLDLTTSGDVPFDIPVPQGDPYFDPAGTGTAVIYLSRSIFDASSGTAAPLVQQQSYTLNFQPPARWR